MRMSKKILTILLVLALSLSTAAVAFAEEAPDAEHKAKVLNQLDLFLGVDTEVYTPALGAAADRAAAMVMVARALGWTAAADFDANATSGYTDVPYWAEAHVAYAVEQGVTVGIGDGLFGNAMPITERQLQTWFDRALGKADAWEDNAALDNNVGLVRADLVNGTWEALMEVPVGGSETLIEGIVGDDDDMLWKAMSGGLVEPLEVDLDPADYTITGETEMGYYVGGDTLEITFLGLEPFTQEEVFVYIQHGGGGFPYHTSLFEGVEEGTGLVGIVEPDGSLTVSGVLLEDIPVEGPFAAILSGYGYNIDHTLNLMFGTHTVGYGIPEWTPEPSIAILNDGEPLALSVGDEFALADTVEVMDQYNREFEGEFTAALWQSSDPDVVEVDAESGVVTALAEGTATITLFIDEGPDATVEVTVTE